ncbi:MAG TPA: phosphatase PAP2 family protein [Nocardioidaceae bacterium]|nr:phosphatase PAP2 family protein [Nocardioidaceae bacterium]
MIAAVFGVVTAIKSEAIGIPLRDPSGSMFRGRLASMAVLLVVFAVADVTVRAVRAGFSARQLAASARERLTARRLALIAGVLLAYQIVYVCYRNLKSWDAFNTPRDDDLLSLEKSIFFGHSPAVLLHDLLGQDVAAHVLAAIYDSFSSLVLIAVVASVVFTRQIRDGYVFVTAAAILWILGVTAYYLVPTIGPFWSAPSEFAGLDRTAVTSAQEKYVVERAHLLQSPGAGDAFSSLSAFASLHTAFTFLILLSAYIYGLRLLSIVLAVYFAGVVVATIYFGWHFVVDDIAGCALAALALYLGRLVVYPRGRPRRAVT